MKATDQIKLELKELNNQYRKGNLSYKGYKRRFSIIKNYNSISNQVKRFGAKVVKSGGGYEYIGKNFNCYLFLDGCETDFWTSSYEGDDNKIYSEVSEYGYKFDTKNDVVNFLLSLDKSL